MNNIKTAGPFGSNRRGALVVLLAVAIPLGYYLFFYVVKGNFRVVVPNKVYSSVQPSPTQLKKWVRLYGIRAVINLRGDAGKDTEDEIAAANDLGIKVVTIHLKSSALPTKDSLTKLINTLETAEQPILMHCRDGVERSGLAGTMAAMAIGKENYDKAKWQAYVAPGPWKREHENNYIHISDTLKFYEMHRRHNEPDMDDWQQFKDWVNRTSLLDNRDIKYESTYSYFPLFSKTKCFFPIAKLARDTWVQFTVELVLLTLAGFMIYCKVLKN